MSNMGMRKVAFLDTNILHFIHLYLTEAKKRDLFPMNGDITKAQQHLSEMSDRRQRESLEKGLYVVDNLSMEDCSVQYSLASEIELMVGRARGKALVNAASEGIPDRMWNHFRDQEIHERLNEKDLLDIRSEIGNMGEMLDEAGIDATASDGGRTKDVLDLAKHIVGLVYMGVVDSVIYANALVARADHLISNEPLAKPVIGRVFCRTVAGQGTVSGRDAAFAGWLAGSDRHRRLGARDVGVHGASLPVIKEDNSILTLPSDVAQAWLPEESTEAGGPLL